VKDVVKTLNTPEPISPKGEPEPRWPALIAVLAVGGIYAALPSQLIVGPRGIFPAIVIALQLAIIIAHRTGRHRLNENLGYAMSGLLTLGLVVSLALLIEALPKRKESPAELLQSAGSLWITNILVFALWYWRLDAGGPHQRDKRAGHPDGAILFPQMLMSEEALAEAGQQNWSPNFVDYLFLAFNTSTAFSPTDTPVLERWAKILMMLQSLLSLMIIALLAGRAVNIL
jgi:hypothetical protein